MIKNKNNLNSYNKTTIIFGYSLFALTVVSFLVSTAIPFGMILSNPTARHFNIIAMIVAFGIAALLPALVSYMIGDRATHAKNKLLHHYNGVLFGMAAYWTMQLFSLIGFGSFFGVNELPFPIPLVVTNVIPAVLTIILMAIVATAYTRRQKIKASVLQYRPYQIMLLASVVAPFVYSMSLTNSSDAASIAVSFGLLAIPAVMTLIAYRVLAKYNTTRFARLCDAIIAMSMGWISTWLTGSVISLLQLPYQFAGICSYVIGVGVFASYLYLRTRKAE